MRSQWCDSRCRGSWMMNIFPSDIHVRAALRRSTCREDAAVASPGGTAKTLPSSPGSTEDGTTFILRLTSASKVGAAPPPRLRNDPQDKILRPQTTNELLCLPDLQAGFLPLHPVPRSLEPETGPCNLVKDSQSRTGQPSVLRRGSAARVCTLCACRSVTVLSHSQEPVRRTDSNCHCEFVFGCLRGRSSFPLRGWGGWAKGRPTRRC